MEPSPCLRVDKDKEKEGQKLPLGVCRLREAIVYAALFHNGVSGMTGFDFRIYREVRARYRTIPNIVVALSVPHE